MCQVALSVLHRISYLILKIQNWPVRRTIIQNQIIFNLRALYSVVAGLWPNLSFHGDTSPHSPEPGMFLLAGSIIRDIAANILDSFEVPVEK